MTPTIDMLRIADDAADWRSAGFVVDGDGGCNIGLVRVGLAGTDAGSGFLGWTIRDLPAALGAGTAAAGASAAGTADKNDSLDTIALDGLDGIPTAASRRPPDDPAEHPNGATRIDHVVLTSGDGERTEAAFEAVGWDLRRVRDVPGSDPSMQQRFFRAADVILELVTPTTPTDAERGRPARLYGLALVSADLDATVEALAGRCNPAKEAVQPGRRIATLRTRDLGISVPIAFMTP